MRLDFTNHVLAGFRCQGILKCSSHCVLMCHPIMQELIALGEAVGTESRGLSTEAIAALPRFNYALDSKDDSTSAEQ